jgi:hypothetical protein
LVRAAAAWFAVLGAVEAGMSEQQPGFFDADERLRALSAAGDPLERSTAVVDFELVRAELDA